MDQAAIPRNDSRREAGGGPGVAAESVWSQSARHTGMPPIGEIRASRFSADALDLLRLLEKHGVDYVIAGGQAVIFHGYPRLTWPDPKKVDMTLA